MEIKVNIDEATIIKSVMNGLSTGEIQQTIIDRVRDRIIDYVEDKLEDKIEAIQGKVCSAAEKEFRDKLAEEVKEKVLKEWTATKFKKGLKGQDINDWFEDTLADAVNEFLEVALNNWLQLEIGVGTGKNKKHIEITNSRR